MKGEECPGCGGAKHLTTPEGAKKIYDTNSWQGNTGMLEISTADRVCAWCKAIRINGEWTRMQSLQSRKSELKQMGSNKSFAELNDSLTAGDGNL